MMSTGFMGAENADIPLGGSVAVFAQGPVGLMATVGARMLADEHPTVRANAATLLGAVGGQRAIPWLVDALRTASADQRSPFTLGLVACTRVRPPAPEKPLTPLPGTRGARHWSQADAVVSFYLDWCKRKGLAAEPPPGNPEWHYRADYVGWVDQHPGDPLAAVAIEILDRSAPAAAGQVLAAVLRDMTRKHPGTLAAREAAAALRRSAPR
jgi:hypothetical protein